MDDFEVSELLRKIRNEIGQLEVHNSEGYRVRARALTILFNAEHKRVMASSKETGHHARASDATGA